MTFLTFKGPLVLKCTTVLLKWAWLNGIMGSWSHAIGKPSKTVVLNLELFADSKSNVISVTWQFVYPLERLMYPRLRTAAVKVKCDPRAILSLRHLKALKALKGCQPFLQVGRSLGWKTRLDWKQLGGIIHRLKKNRKQQNPDEITQKIDL